MFCKYICTLLSFEPDTFIILSEIIKYMNTVWHLIISQDESQGYTGFRHVALARYFCP